jgi:hypothetical protein
MKEYKDLITGAFNEIFIRPGFNEAMIRRYFSDDYEQYVDGKILYLQQFISHVKLLKETILSLSFDFQTLVQENNIVFSRHIVKAVKQDDTAGETQVIAEFHIREGKITYCNELTRLISGEKGDHDLGSRY